VRLELRNEDIRLFVIGADVQWAPIQNNGSWEAHHHHQLGWDDKKIAAATSAAVDIAKWLGPESLWRVQPPSLSSWT
jgi:hypothetical protein